MMDLLKIESDQWLCSRRVWFTWRVWRRRYGFPPFRRHRWVATEAEQVEGVTNEIRRILVACRTCGVHDHIYASHLAEFLLVADVRLPNEVRAQLGLAQIRPRFWWLAVLGRWTWRAVRAVGRGTWRAVRAVGQGIRWVATRPVAWGRRLAAWWWGDLREDYVQVGAPTESFTEEQLDALSERVAELESDRTPRCAKCRRYEARCGLCLTCDHCYRGSRDPFTGEHEHDRGDVRGTFGTSFGQGV